MPAALLVRARRAHLDRLPRGRLRGGDRPRAASGASSAPPAGFGGLRAAREPLPICRSAVERTFEHRGVGRCINPDFLLSGADATYTVTATRREDDPRD